MINYSDINFLISYYFFKDSDIEKIKNSIPATTKIFADSGAFSAMTQGTEINIQEYCQWLKRWDGLFETYSNLDVIFDIDKTLQNQKILEDAGLKPLPVFHVGEDFKHLANYTENYNYIALGLGGMTGRRAINNLICWYAKCFEVTKEQVKFHGFAQTSKETLSTFRWYSADSSAWSTGGKYGSLPIFDYNFTNQWYVCEIRNRELWQHERIIKYYGFEVEDFIDYGKKSYVKAWQFGAISYWLLEKWLRQFYKNDFNLYMVALDDKMMKSIAEGINRFRENNLL